MSPNEPTAPDLDAIRADIEDTTAALGDSVEALAAKVDVKARAKDTALDVGHSVRDRPAPVALALTVLAAAVVVIVLLRRRRHSR